MQERPLLHFKFCYDFKRVVSKMVIMKNVLYRIRNRFIQSLWQRSQMEQLCLTNVLNLVIVLFFDPAGSQPLLKISRHFNLRKYFFFLSNLLRVFFVMSHGRFLGLFQNPLCRGPFLCADLRHKETARWLVFLWYSSSPFSRDPTDGYHQQHDNKREWVFSQLQ